MSDCNLCAWLDSLEVEDMKLPTEEDGARFARFLEQEWVVDLHDHSADVTTVEAAADHLKDMGV